MIGRDAELARAVQALRSPPSVVMIEGEAGQGKSRWSPSSPRTARCFRDAS